MEIKKSSLTRFFSLLKTSIMLGGYNLLQYSLVKILQTLRNRYFSKIKIKEI